MIILVLEHSSTGLNQNEPLISLFLINFVRRFMRDFSEPEELLAELQCVIALNGETYFSRTEPVRSGISMYPEKIMLVMMMVIKIFFSVPSYVLD